MISTVSLKFSDNSIDIDISDNPSGKWHVITTVSDN